MDKGEHLRNGTQVLRIGGKVLLDVNFRFIHDRCQLDANLVLGTLQVKLVLNRLQLTMEVLVNSVHYGRGMVLTARVRRVWAQFRHGCGRGGGVMMMVVVGEHLLDMMTLGAVMDGSALDHQQHCPQGDSVQLEVHGDSGVAAVVE